RLSLDRERINDALAVGFSKITGSLIPQSFDMYWQPPALVHDPAQATTLLAEAGYPKGFDAGSLYCDSSYSNVAEAVLNNLAEVGIRIGLRPIERAGYLKEWGDKKLKNVIQCGSGAFGNAATRLAAFVGGGGNYAYCSYPH